MRGKVAKRLRKMAYGDLSLREPIPYVYGQNKKQKSQAGVTRFVPKGHPCRNYHLLKRAWKLGYHKAINAVEAARG